MATGTKLVLFGLLASMFLLQGCPNPVTFPNEPVIEFKSIAPTDVREGRDSIILGFTFTDGDGDLGLPQSDTTNDVLIQDIRVGFPPIDYNYRMQVITPDGRNKAISGEIFITIPNTFRRPGVEVDTLYYNVRIKDRAGNFSNEVQTPQVIVRGN